MSLEKILLLIASTLAVFADTLCVWWAKSNNVHWAVMASGIFINAIAMVFWSHSVKGGVPTSVSITSYAIFSIAVCAILDYFVFGENLNIFNWVGIFLSILALILMML